MKIITTALLSSILISPCFALTSTHEFSPYIDMTLKVHWDSGYNDLEPVDLTDLSKNNGAKSYHLAFITDAGGCNAAWGGQSAYAVKDAWGKHMTDKMLTQKINAIISFGGASGNDLSAVCTTSQLTTAYEQVIKTYQPKGLDFDIENGTANVANIMTALQQIQKNHPQLKISFTLPTMPEGLIASGQSVVTQAKTAALDFSVNIMAMDYGPSYNGNMGDYAIQAATSLFTYLQTLYPQQPASTIWNMVEVTPMIGVNDVNVEEFTLSNADALRTFATQKNLGNLSMWDASRDYPCDGKWTKTDCSSDNLQKNAYEYAQHLNQY